MIKVGSKFEKGAYYIGRGSPLGNPFVMGSEDDRDLVCDKYQIWFNGKIKEKDPGFMFVLTILIEEAK